MLDPGSLILGVQVSLILVPGFLILGMHQVQVAQRKTTSHSTLRLITAFPNTGFA